MRYRWLVWVASLLAISCALADGPLPSSLNRYDDRKILTLSKEMQWRRLLGFSSPQSRVSDVKATAFFLSRDGRRDPLREMNATLNAFYSSSPQDLNDHAVCRFPARFLWLSQHFDFQEIPVTPDECPGYTDFSLNGDVESISLIYATGYLGNPASYYGHLLVRLNRHGENVRESLDDTAINFGAIIPDNENMLVYIGKGIFGGYDAGYTHREYFYHTHNYGENELRDLWEYRLALSDSDRTLLVAHLWELLAKEYTYYFFNRNCAYQIAQLFTVVTGENYTNANRPWVLPQQIVQAVNGSAYRGTGLVESIDYIPSRQSRLYARYEELGAKERKRVEQAAHRGSPALEETIVGAEESQKRVLDTLLDYYQFRQVKADVDEVPDIEREHRAVLMRRFELEPGGGALDLQGEDAPHEGRPPSYFSVGLQDGPGAAPRYTVRVRPAYYDSLDAQGRSVAFSTLAMGDITVSFGEEGSQLEKLTIVEVESIQQNKTGLPGDRGHSWRLSVGAEQKSFSCADCLAAKGMAAAGYSSSFGSDRMVLSGFIGGGYFATTDTSEGFFVEPSLQLNWRLSGKVNLQAYWGEQHFYHSDRQRQARLDARVSLTTNTDLRLFFENRDVHFFGLSVGYYW